MDGDLQDRPEEIPKMYNSILNSDYRIIFAKKIKRSSPSLDRITSKIYFTLLNKVTKGALNPDISSFVIFDDEVAETYLKLNEKSKFLGAMLIWLGFKYTTILIKHDKRKYGKSKYNLFNKTALAFNEIYNFTSEPLILFTYIGMFVSLLAISFGFYLVLQYLLFSTTVLINAKNNIVIQNFIYN